MKTKINEILQEANQVLQEFHQSKENIECINNAAKTLVSSFRNGGKVFSCGNGGSMCDSLHFCEELTGRFKNDRPPLPAISMGDPGHMTCVSNDFGPEFVFSRHVEALGKDGDVLLAISTSGNSPNVIKAVEVAKEKNIKIIGLLGKDGGKLKTLVDIPIIVKHNKTERIQEIHIKVIHTLLALIEDELF